ncbi:hypothetical protein AWN90_31975 [Nocardia terpenica]|uniref:Uncharacterized protein n=2 Tax=Nocardia terpenica TaxID=455432 RepID=A0A164MED4_9NOCA|nr:hypothetical protein AWN90_31975 [Nocardia terpenica]
MSSFLTATTHFTFESAEYWPEKVNRYGPDDRYESRVPAYIYVRLGAVTVMLTIEDARALADALPNVLAEHEYADYVADAAVQVKAVA